MHAKKATRNIQSVDGDLWQSSLGWQEFWMQQFDKHSEDTSHAWEFENGSRSLL